MRRLQVLIPTYRRRAALAVTLAGLAAQTRPPESVIVSDQSPRRDGAIGPEIDALVRILALRGTNVDRRVHLPRRGLAEHRQSLLDLADAPYVLFLDDDVWLEPDLIERLLRAIEGARCGFVGSAVIGLSHTGDVRPGEEDIEFWSDGPRPESVRPGGAAWLRHRLHNAANLLHVRQRLGRSPDRLYKVAWVGGCVLYDTAILRDVGGFGFWRELPLRHVGEDVLAQLRVMERAGGAGIFPSGAFHLELPTTVRDRRVDAPIALMGRAAAPPLHRSRDA
jgi:GT2 family glycosyltransferase